MNGVVVDVAVVDHEVAPRREHPALHVQQGPGGEAVARPVQRGAVALAEDGLVDERQRLAEIARDAEHAEVDLVAEDVVGDVMPGRVEQAGPGVDRQPPGLGALDPVISTKLTSFRLTC